MYTKPLIDTVRSSEIVRNSLPASVVACRLGHVSQPVKCGGFAEGPEGVTPLLARLSPLVSGVTVLQ